MDAGFWHDRWQRQQISFHRDVPNPSLQAWWCEWVPAGARVLVPLCGKSVDIAWLAAQGYEVVGAELSALAVKAFFHEQGLEPQVSQQGEHCLYQAGPVQIWQGDFFTLSPAQVGACTAYYDRAGLIALPPSMRAGYAEHLATLLPSGALGMLIGLDFIQGEIEGPPFATPGKAITELLGMHWALREAGRTDALPEASPRYHQAGLAYLDETTYWLCKR